MKSIQSLSASVVKVKFQRRLNEPKAVLVAAVRMEGRSTVEDQRPINSYRPILLCIRGTSSFRMSLELDRNGRRPTEKATVVSEVHGNCCNE